MAFIESICPECGAKIIINDEMESCFCMSCGKKILVVKTQDGGRKADADALMARADSFFSNKEYYKASQYYDQVLDIFPSLLKAHIGLILSRLEWDELRVDTVPQCKALLKNKDFVHALDTADDEGRAFFTGLKEKAEKMITDYRFEREALISERRAELLPFCKLLKSNKAGLFGLHADGTVSYYCYASDKDDYFPDISNWKGIVEICTGSELIIGRRYNGDVVIAKESWRTTLLPWKKIISVDARDNAYCGVSEDGHLYVGGYFSFCDTEVLQQTIDNWSDIKKAYVFEDTKGLIAIDGSGRIFTAGGPENRYKNHTDIVEVSVGTNGNYTCLTADGHVLADRNITSPDADRIVAGWDHVISILHDTSYPYVLMSDGTVDTVNETKKNHNAVTELENIVSIYKTNDSLLALRDDCTLLSCPTLYSSGTHESLCIPDIVGFNCFWNLFTLTISIRKDGTLSLESMEGSSRKYWAENLNSWRLFTDYRTFAEEQRQAMEELEHKEKQLCTEKENKRNALKSERSALNSELETLTGLFQGKRASQCRTRINEIDCELINLDRFTW